jgi:hypothetical protein
VRVHVGDTVGNEVHILLDGSSDAIPAPATSRTRRWLAAWCRLRGVMLRLHFAARSGSSGQGRQEHAQAWHPGAAGGDYGRSSSLLCPNEDIIVDGVTRLPHCGTNNEQREGRSTPRTDTRQLGGYMSPPEHRPALSGWHCQLKRPWYARRVGGAAARVGELLCSPIMLPRSSRAGPEKGALGPLS